MGPRLSFVPVVYFLIGSVANAAPSSGTQYLPPGTACDDSHLYQVMYGANGDHKVCDFVNQLGYTVYMWLPITGGDPVVVPGTVMPDGTIYAGNGLFTTPADAPGGYTAGCGTHLGYFAGYDTGASSWTDGRSNTSLAAAGTPSCAASNFAAQRYCWDLVAYGHDDWYLPAIGQLRTVLQSHSAIGGFLQSSYWSSTENYQTNGNPQWDAGIDGAGNVGVGSGGIRYQSKHVRCIR